MLIAQLVCAHAILTTSYASMRQFGDETRKEFEEQLSDVSSATVGRGGRGGTNDGAGRASTEEGSSEVRGEEVLERTLELWTKCETRLVLWSTRNERTESVNEDICGGPAVWGETPTTFQDDTSSSLRWTNKGKHRRGRQGSYNCWLCDGMDRLPSLSCHRKETSNSSFFQVVHCRLNGAVRRVVDTPRSVPEQMLRVCIDFLPARVS